MNFSKGRKLVLFWPKGAAPDTWNSALAKETDWKYCILLEKQCVLIPANHPHAVVTLDPDLYIGLSLYFEPRKHA